MAGMLLIDMDETQVGNGRTIGSVKAAIDKYGGRFKQVTDAYSAPKTQKKASESEIKPLKAQLHIAKKIFNQINEDKEMAEKERSRAESELRRAKKLVEDLRSQIQVSKVKSKDRIKELDMLNKRKTVEGEDHDYAEVAQQVEDVKRELSKIRLDMVRLSEEKSRAEKEAEVAGLKISSYMESIERFRAEIEASKEEEVLVELAQIEARKELAATEAQKKEESERFSSRIEETRRKINSMRVAIEEVKDLEEKLAVVNSDVQVLQQLKLIKEMDASAGSSKMKNSDSRSVIEDIADAKKELESIKGETFQLMTSMDGIRVELQRILEEKAKVKKLEEKNVRTAKNLNSKLTKAKNKLQVAVSLEEKAKSMLSSLHLALEKLETEKEAAEKERVVAIEETTNIKTEIQKTETATDSIEEKLQDAIQELADVKSAEAKSLKKLKGVIENAVRSRASRKKATIRISIFEHDYLTGCAVEAQAMADKKVAAAQAWTEALKASEREINMKVAAAERKIKEMRLKEEQQMSVLEKSLKATKVEEEEEVQSKMRGNKNFQAKRSIKENAYQLTTVPQSQFRRSVGLPTTRRLTSSGSITIKRRRKVVLKLAKYFIGKQTKDEKGV